MFSSLWIGPAMFSVLVGLGTIFYHSYNEWEISTCIYYAVQVLVGCLYASPTEEDNVSKTFTLLLYIFGTTLVAGAVSAFMNSFILNFQTIAADERRKTRKPIKRSVRIRPFFKSWFMFLHKLWNENMLAMITLIWITVGFLYGKYYEEWDNFTSLYFAVAVLSSRGDPTPKCEFDGATVCNLGVMRSFFYTVYCVVGTNLYIKCMGGLSTLLCERAVRRHERKVLSKPISEAEFEVALNLGKKSNGKHQVKLSEVKLDIKDFIILELIRLQKVDVGFIAEVQEVFREIDTNDNGMLDMAELEEHHARFYDEHHAQGSEPYDYYNKFFVSIVNTPKPQVIKRDISHDLLSSLVGSGKVLSTWRTADSFDADEDALSLDTASRSTLAKNKVE